MSKYAKKDFSYEEDFIISAECENCGHVTEDENDFDHDCSKCGGYMINNTSHEDCECAICGKYIDMFEDAYRHDEDTDILICTKCYDDLEDEE